MAGPSKERGLIEISAHRAVRGMTLLKSHFFGFGAAPFQEFLVRNNL
jgi:hypothetical protein